MTTAQQPRDPAFEARVRASFARQSLMTTIGASLAQVEPGSVTIVMPHAPHILQQHGFVHGGVTTALADTAAGFSALTLMPAGLGVLAVEFKINLLAPAKGDRFVAIGRVIRSGRVLTVAQAEVVAHEGCETRPIALMTATMMAIEGRDGVVD